MLVSFLIPLAALITATTGLAVSGVRGRYKSGPSEDAARLSLRLGAALLPLFAVSWFLGVLALEQPESIAAALLFAGTAALFNWLVFACSGALFPDCPSVLAARSPPPAPTLQHAGDAQPLLPACASNASPNAWERGQRRGAKLSVVQRTRQLQLPLKKKPRKRAYCLNCVSTP
ncbi:hypothetical protein B566_EDAN001892 [Ephemera danica]|nr:hypothetical protein B566_EDAN001892 [Ephemera danica]